MQTHTQKEFFELFETAAGEKVRRCFLNIDGNRSELLNGIHHQPDSTLAAKRAESSQVAAIPVAPLDGAEGDDFRFWSYALGKRFDEGFAVAMRHDVNTDTARGQLNPR